MAALLKAIKVSAGDEVVVQAFTCVAVVEAVMALGAKPIYVDIEPYGYNICPKDLVNKITNKTKVLVVQHTFGIPAAMKAIISIAESANVLIIEDCCHTICSSQDGQVVGSWGIGSFFSFEWGKPVAVGIGGVALTKSDEIKDRLYEDFKKYTEPPKIKNLKVQIQYIAHKLLYRPRFYWIVRGTYKTLGNWGIAEGNYHSVKKNIVSEEFGWKILPTIKNRIISEIKNIQIIADHAREVAKIYRSTIDNKNVGHPIIPPGCDPIFARYPIRIQNKENVLNMARRENVELADWYSSPVHPLSKDDLIKVGYVADSCKQAEMRCNEVVTLPTHRKTGTKDISRAVKFINSL